MQSRPNTRLSNTAVTGSAALLTERRADEDRVIAETARWSLETEPDPDQLEDMPNIQEAS